MLMGMDVISVLLLSSYTYITKPEVVPLDVLNVS